MKGGAWLCGFFQNSNFLKMNSTHKFFAAMLFGSIGGWHFLGSTSKYPILAIPIVIIWALYSLKNKIRA